MSLTNYGVTAMSKFSWLNKISEIDNTPEQAIASYGGFVKYMNDLEERVKRQNSFMGRRWTQARIAYAEGEKAIPFFHKAICDKFGSDAMFKAINAHPFA